MKNLVNFKDQSVNSDCFLRTVVKTVAPQIIVFKYIYGKITITIKFEIKIEANSFLFIKIN